MALVLSVMGILCLPLLVINYYGDFGGFNAGALAKLTIGNIGICGRYRELCPDADSYLYRGLLSGRDTLLRSVTPWFGGFSSVAIGVFAIFCTWFYYFYRPFLCRQYDDRHTTPTDYAVEVDYLPRSIEPELLHTQYEKLLKEHFEKIAGAENSVAEVALARDYDGAIRTFLEIDRLDIDITEAKAQASQAGLASKDGVKWTEKIEKMEKTRTALEDKVRKQALVDEAAKCVCRAFVTFTEQRFQRRVLSTYVWSAKGTLLRWLQTKALRFEGHAVRVRATCEPNNIYQENLDVSRGETRCRKLFTSCASLLILLIAIAILAITQTATRAASADSIGSHSIWVISNTTETSGLCMETCAVSFYSDSECTQSLNEFVVGVIDSSGLYTAGPVALTTRPNPGDSVNSTCTLNKVWRSDRCTSVQAGNEIMDSGKVFFDPPITSGSALVDTPTTVSLSAAAKMATTAVTLSAVVNTAVVHAPTVFSSDPQTLPSSSSVCPVGSTLCSSLQGPPLHICYRAAQECDGVWQCPYGDDEANCTSQYTCDGPNQMLCPDSGKCVDSLVGSCGNECAFGANATTSATCVSIDARVSQNATEWTTSQCDESTVSSLLTPGSCPDEFLASPCCYVSSFSEDSRQTLATCPASSVVDDLASTYSGLSFLEWTEDYCSAAANDNLDNVADTTCSDSDVWLLYTASPNCFASLMHNRRWCSCLTDTLLLPLDVKVRLETCNVPSSSYYYFGSTPGGATHASTSLMDVIRIGCETVTPMKDNPGEGFDSPLVSVAYQLEGLGLVGGDTVLAETIAVLNAATLDATVSVSVAVDSGVANVRLDIDDRSASASLQDWIDNVAFAFANATAAIATAFPAHTTFRTRSTWEPHCVANSTNFQCPVTRACIPSSSVCDGIPDCEIPVTNGTAPADEDQSVCPTEEQTPTGESNTCAPDQFTCQSADQCIPYVFWCDGVSDCTDESDETNTDCVAQIDIREVSNTSSSVVAPYDTGEYIGFRFNESVSVRCVAMDQPVHSVSSLIAVYACDQSAVFRPGQGSVMRYPDLSCLRVDSFGLRSESEATEITQPARPSLISASAMVYNILGPVQYGCAVQDTTCPVVTGVAGSFCDPVSLLCSYPVNGTVAVGSVTDRPSCDLLSPISPAVAQMIKLNYTYADGSVNSDILDVGTYTCFCDQQAQYNGASSAFYIFPPYTTDIQQTCDTYYSELVKQKAIALAAVIVVAFINFVLQLIMYWFADYERSYSLTARASSEMWKLFLGQFINTALLVLVVNAHFYSNRGDTWSFAGLGNGQFSDITSYWFIRVGAGVCLTMMLLIGTTMIPNALIALVMKCLRRKWAKRKLTQPAMNRQLEYYEFSLSLRLAQTTNMIVVVVMYFSPMPLMLWIGVVYCFIAYWFDKYSLLRNSKIPPQYSDETLKICLRLMPIAVIANSCIMLWSFGNQTLFPSDFVSQAIQTLYDDHFDAHTMNEYLAGDISFTDTNQTYGNYLLARTMDGLRKASIGAATILALIAIFFVFKLLWFMFSETIGSVFTACMYGYKRNREPSRPRMQRTSSLLGAFAGQNHVDLPPFADAKATMEKQRLLSSYKLQANPRYKAAYEAINRVKQNSIKKSLRVRESKESLAQGKMARRTLESGGLSFNSPQLDPIAVGERRMSNTNDSDGISPSGKSASIMLGKSASSIKYPSLNEG